MGVQNLFNQKAFAEALDGCKYSINEIADMIGCKPNDLYRYRKGEAVPRIERLKKLIAILGPSITGLAVTSGEMPSTQFTQEERRYLAWFRALPTYRQARILGYTQAVYEFGSDVDAEFAADFAEQLVVEEERQKEQPG
jgi:predicted transcriptional regulator